MSNKILLADDSITIQKVVELTFSDGDFEVVAVANGARALAKLQEWRPDIVLADVIMPERNGYEVCEAIKTNPATADIPVILLTGTFEPFDPDRAEAVRADAIVTKPFESQNLVAKVEQLLAARAAAAAPPPPVAAPRHDVSTGAFAPIAEPPVLAPAFVPVAAPPPPPPAPVPLAPIPPPPAVAAYGGVDDDIFASRDIEADINAFEGAGEPADPFAAFDTPAEPSPSASVFDAPSAPAPDNFGTMFIPSASLASEIDDVPEIEPPEPLPAPIPEISISDPFAAFAPPESPGETMVVSREDLAAAPPPPTYVPPSLPEPDIFSAAPAEPTGDVFGEPEPPAAADAGTTRFIPPVTVAFPELPPAEPMPLPIQSFGTMFAPPVEPEPVSEDLFAPPEPVVPEPEPSMFEPPTPVEPEPEPSMFEPPTPVEPEPEPSMFEPPAPVEPEPEPSMFEPPAPVEPEPEPSMFEPPAPVEPEPEPSMFEPPAPVEPEPEPSMFEPPTPVEPEPEPSMFEPPTPVEPEPEPSLFESPTPVAPEPVLPVAVPVAEPPAPALAAPIAAAAAAISFDAGSLSEADLDRLAKKVVAKLSEAVIREIAWEVVPDLAEIIVRKRIAELEAETK